MRKKKSDIENEQIEESKYDFKELLEHLETLPSYQERIAHLITEKTKYEQKSNNFLDDAWGNISFSGKCMLEIEKYRELIKLGKIPNNPIDSNKKHKDLTLDRAALFMDYLFRHSKTTSFNNAKAEAISFLTGYSSETLRQRLSSIDGDKNKRNSSYKRDLRIVRNLFDRLGLVEIIKDIDRKLMK